jgi:transcription elongation factor Elf1
VLYYASMTISTDNKYVRLLSSRLRNFKQKKEGLYNFSCPICGDSKKNLTKARGYVFQKGNDLYYRCHNCGISTNVAGLLKAVDASLYGEYILERYKTGRTNNANSANAILQLTTPRFGKVQKQRVFEHAEWANKLPSGHFCLDYIKNRKIPIEFYDKILFTSNYKKFVDSVFPNHGKEIIDDSRLVIPYYDENDELIAVSGRALETSDKSLRYITIRTNDSQNKLIYGMDRIILSETVHLVEGPIDSMFLNNCLASGDANLALSAQNIHANEIILIFDNQPRNKEVCKLIENAIKLNHNVVIWPDRIQEKDINEMVMSGISQDEIKEIISSNTFNGLRAQLKFNLWKKR